jgi:hypothetical protein
MGGSKKPTIGYENYLGVHFIVGLGPVDALLKIEIDRLTAWEGYSTGGRILINKRELFGGREREGGVSGYVDVLPGYPDQGKNDYLQRLRGAIVPAYRGLMSVVLRQVYIGNNPYLKPWAFKVQRVFVGYDGAPQWYPEKAGIFRGVKSVNAAIYFALDGSRSLSVGDWNAEVAAVVALLQEIKASTTGSKLLNDIQIVTFGGTLGPTFRRRNCYPADYDAAIAWLSALPFPDNSGTNFDVALSLAEDFFLGSSGIVGDLFGGSSINIGALPSFGIGAGGSRDKRRIVIFITDGVPALASVAPAVDIIESIAQLEVYCFNLGLSDTTYTAQLDNTPADGVPVLALGDPEPLLEAMRAAFSLGYDMNPAHILREVLIDPDTGGSGDAGEIDDAIFTAAADTLYDEGFGLSFHWRNLGSRQDFIELVEQHIDGKVYQDRQSGLWGLKLLRLDYDPDEIPHFGREHIVEWESLLWPDPFELPNYVTVIYSDTTKDEDGSVSIANPARVQQAGGKVNQRKIELRGIHNAELAASCAARDLAALSAPLLNGIVVFRYFPATINRGDPIKITDESVGVSGVVCRVLEILDGDGRENSVRVQIIEDRGGRAEAGLVVVPPPEIEDELPLPSSPRLVEEAPYYALVQELGQTVAESTIADEPFSGYVSATGASPYPATINALYNVDAGSGYEQNGTVDFSPVHLIRSALSRDPTQTKVFVDADVAADGIRIGSLLYIAGEYMSLVSIDPAGTSAPGDYWHPASPPPGDVVLVEVGRGCLDTIPRDHAPGEAAIFWQDFSASDGTKYLEGETVEIRLQPVGPEGTLELELAPADEITFASRAARPYPPGNFQIEGSYVDQFLAFPFELTWAHRDRLLQTTGVFDAYTAGDIGPEPGVTYTVRASSYDGDGVLIEENLLVEGLTTTSLSVAEVDLDLPLDPEAARLRVEVVSVRDGFTCWTVPTIDLVVLRAPGDLAIEEVV